MPKIAIIGAGLGGCVLAKTLHDAGADVLLLEKGVGAPLPKTPESFGFSAKPFGMKYTRTIGLGGSTSAWHSGLIRLQKADVDHWSRGGMWPKLEPAYQAAERELLGSRVLRLDDIEAQGAGLLKSSGIAGGAVQARPIRVPLEPYNVFDLFRLGSPERFPRLRTVTGVRDTRLIRQGSGTSISAVEFTAGEGVRERVDVDTVVVAAGGLESPKLLSRFSSEAGCEPNPTLGRYYIDHPMGFLFRLKFKKPMVFGEFFGRKAGSEIVRFGLAARNPIDGLNHLCYLRPANQLTESEDVEDVKRKLAEYRGGRYSPLYLLRVLRHIDLLMEAFSFRFGSNIKCSHATVMMVCEQEPLRERGFRNGALHWFVSDRERRSINRFVEFITDELQPVLDGVAFDPAWKDSRLHSAAHHSGMCRIGPPSEGVVDSDLRVHGWENLFVCDGSVLPSTGHANTGLTIAALAHRLAHRLAPHPAISGREEALAAYSYIRQ